MSWTISGDPSVQAGLHQGDPFQVGRIPPSQFPPPPIPGTRRETTHGQQFYGLDGQWHFVSPSDPFLDSYTSEVRYTVRPWEITPGIESDLRLIVMYPEEMDNLLKRILADSGTIASLTGDSTLNALVLEYDRAVVLLRTAMKLAFEEGLKQGLGYDQ
jgi:hypothetical protein